MAAGLSPHVIRFSPFELDVSGYVLRRDGRPIRLERQPMDLLILLATRPQVLVSRAEIADTLWGKDVFVDVETSIHTAIRKIRQALRDSAEAPRFIETVPGRGYRFIAPIESDAALIPPASEAEVPSKWWPPAAARAGVTVTEARGRAARRDRDRRGGLRRPLLEPGVRRDAGGVALRQSERRWPTGPISPMA